MIRVKMEKTCAGSNDGATVRDYYEGGVYDLSDDLANSFTDKDRKGGPVAKEAAKAKLKDPVPESETEDDEAEVEAEAEVATSVKGLPKA